MRTVFTWAMVLMIHTAMAQPVQDTNQFAVPLASPPQPVSKAWTKKITNLAERFTIFRPLAANEVYSITIAADVPDNARPHKVYVKKQPGHVFIILEQKDTISKLNLAQVWGFYPVRPVSSVFLRNVRCELNDNSGRVYDAAITVMLDAVQFDSVKKKAEALAQKKYNLNKYNCYDYAVELFNSIPGVAALPLTHVKFPFLFGRGGSPCGLYRDLKKLQASGRDGIRIGLFKAPVSSRPVAVHDLANQSINQSMIINH